MIILRHAVPGLVAALVLAARVPAVQEDPLRVATLVPCVEGAVDALGSQAELVATVRTSPAQPIGGGVRDLGNPHSPTLEMLEAARADVVVIDGIVHARLQGRLQQMGLRVLSLDTQSVDGTLDSLSKLGDWSPDGTALAKEIGRVRSVLESRKLRRPTKSLALFVAPGTPMVVTSRTWLGDLIQRLGFENAAEDISGGERFPGFITVSDEVISTLTPEVILLVAHGQPEGIRDSFMKRMHANGVWRSAAESAGENVVVLDPALFSVNPCLEFPRAADWLLEHVEVKSAKSAP